MIMPLSYFSRLFPRLQDRIREAVPSTLPLNNDSLRRCLDEDEPFWTQVRAQIRSCKDSDWTGDLTLAAKGLNSHAKTLSRASDEFTTAYDIFYRNYTGFTAAKLNVWLLTSCQNDVDSLTGKILFLARDIAKKTERNRRPHVFG